MSGKIFINYRRADAQDAAGRLYDRLESEFPPEKLFMDVDRLGAGVDFVDELRIQVAQCDVFLAIMGPHWLNIADDDSGLRRLDNPNDWVRIEIADALARDIRVIPVLVNDAPIPREDQLPDSMAMLARRNAVRLTHERFRSDSQGLIEQIHVAIKEMEEKKTQAAQETELAQKRAERQAKEQATQQAQAQRESAEAEQLAQLGPERFDAMREHNNWAFIQDKDDIGKLRDHLARFPGGETAAYAMEKLEPLVWTGLGDAPDKAVLEGFLREFEQGIHAQEAQERLVALQQKETKAKDIAEWEAREATAWQAVKDTTDAQTLTAFLRDWPNGPHADEAKRLQKALKGSLVSRRSLLIGGGVLVGGGAALAYAPSLWRQIRNSEGYKEALRRIAVARRTKAKYLNLIGIKLEALPPEIGQLTALTRLDLWTNQLTTLPPDIRQLTALTELSIFDNQLTTLPPDIGRLTTLTELNLSNNQLTALPPDIGRLTALTELDLFGSQLTTLPPDIGRLTALTKLNLFSNQLTTLPDNLGRLADNLKGNNSDGDPRLDLRDNPWPPPFDKLVVKGHDAVLDYLRKRL